MVRHGPSPNSAYLTVTLLPWLWRCPVGSRTALTQKGLAIKPDLTDRSGIAGRYAADFNIASEHERNWTSKGPVVAAVSPAQELTDWPADEKFLVALWVVQWHGPEDHLDERSFQEHRESNICVCVCVFCSTFQASVWRSRGEPIDLQLKM